MWIKIYYHNIFDKIRELRIPASMFNFFQLSMSLPIQNYQLAQIYNKQLWRTRQSAKSIKKQLIKYHPRSFIQSLSNNPNHDGLAQRLCVWNGHPNAFVDGAWRVTRILCEFQAITYLGALGRYYNIIIMRDHAEETLYELPQDIAEEQTILEMSNFNSKKKKKNMYLLKQPQYGIPKFKYFYR